MALTTRQKQSRAKYNEATHYIARIGMEWVEGVFELAGLPTGIVDSALADLRSISDDPAGLQYVDALKAAIEAERKIQAEESKLDEQGG